MDPRAFLQKLRFWKAADLKAAGKDRKRLVRLGVGASGALLALAIFVKVSPVIWRESRLAAHAFLPRADAPGIFGTYALAYSSLQAKIYALSVADEENRRLTLENANLRLKLESMHFDCGGKNAAQATHNLEMRLGEETGSRVGRSLASIHYEIPGNLLAQQLYTLAISYFQAREDEKAVVLLTHLASLEEEEAYKTPKNFLMTGISWYRLNNYEVANSYFDKVIRMPSNPESDVNFPAQARLWKALIAERQDRKDSAQHWLHEVLDNHPHSTEAAWINSRASEAAPAGRRSRSHAASRGAGRKTTPATLARHEADQDSTEMNREPAAED